MSNYTVEAYARWMGTCGISYILKNSSYDGIAIVRATFARLLAAHGDGPIMSSDHLPPPLPATRPDAARYRINFLNPDGTIRRTKPIEASSDAEAVQQAKQFMDGRALDLWDGLRFIEFFPRMDEV